MESLRNIAQQATTWLAEAFIASLSFVVFGILDWVDRLLCIVFRGLDFILDPGASPCYCEHSRKHLPHHCETHRLQSNSKKGEVLCTAADAYSSQLSATLYERKHIHGLKLFRSVSNALPMARELGNLGINGRNEEGNKATDCHIGEISASSNKNFSNFIVKCRTTVNKSRSPSSGLAGGKLKSATVSGDLKVRWSDCGCPTCTSWHSSGKELLYVHVEGKDLTATNCYNRAASPQNNVIFIHGFLSSSSLWTERVLPYLSESTKSSYHLFAIDLLGFGKSPKPGDCFYTMADHLEKIKISVLQPYKIDSFHLVAHSMGCIVALALAASYPDAVKSIILVSPPYFPPPSDEPAGSYVLRQVAPRRIWPPVAFGASVMSWYEHVGRGVCFIVCKNHRLWESITKLLTINRIPSFWIQDFMQHTHHSAWHIFHNVICGEAYALDGYLDVLERADCDIHIVHGSKDTLVPVQCSIELQRRFPKTNLNVVGGANHVTVIMGREQAFTQTLDETWRSTSSKHRLVLS